MELKPLDIVIALCIGLDELVAQSDRDGIVYTKPKIVTIRDYAEFCGVSVGAVAASQKRLKSFGLISLVPNFLDSDSPEVLRLNRLGLVEFLEYGIRYYSLVERNGFGLGTPTSWTCPFVKSEMLPPDIPLVWEDPQGEIKGEFISPIHPSVVNVSQKCPPLYRVFSTIDSIRLGKPRELIIARKLLRQYLGIQDDK